MAVTLALKFSDLLKTSKGGVQAETPEYSVDVAFFLMNTWTR